MAKTLIVATKNDLEKIISKRPEIKKTPEEYTIFVIDSDRNEHDGLKCKTIADYPKIKEKLKTVYTKSIEWLMNWPDNKFENDKNFKELVTYRGVSLWWFVRYWLMWVDYFNFVSISNIVKTIDVVKTLIEDESPQKIIFFDDNQLHNQIIKTISNKQKIEQEFIKSSVLQNIKENLTMTLISYGIRTAIRLKQIIRKYSYIFQNILQSKKYTKHKIAVFTVFGNLQKSLDIKTGKLVMKDIMASDIIEKINESSDLQPLTVEAAINLGFELDSLRRKESTVFFEYYMNYHVRQKIRENVNYINKLWKRLQINQKFKGSFEYDGVLFWEIIKIDFEEIFNRRFPEAMKYMEMIQNFIDKEHPEVIVTVDEVGPIGRALASISRLNNVPSIAIQHGFFGPYEIGHIFREGEVWTRDEPDPNKSPIPDKSTVYGQAVKDFYVKQGHYPSDSVVITGQPRYDVLADAGKYYKKDDLCRKLGIDPNKKIVLLAEHGFHWSETEKTMNTVFTTFKELSDIQLIVKLHRSETRGDKIKALADKIDFNCIVSKDLDIYAVLNSCDAVITTASSVGLEAMILGKPLLVLNLTGKDDEHNYAQSGAALGVYSADNLKDSINKILYDETTRKSLKEKMNKFVELYAYKIDGHASERTLNLIRELIKPE